MSTLDCYQLVDLYANWLKEKVKPRSIGDLCELTTPFVDRHNKWDGSIKDAKWIYTDEREFYDKG